ERELPRPADPVEVRHDGAVRRSVDRVDLEPGQRAEVSVAFGRLVVAALPAHASRVRAGLSVHRPSRKNSRTSYYFESTGGRGLRRTREARGAVRGGDLGPFGKKRNFCA